MNLYYRCASTLLRKNLIFHCNQLVVQTSPSQLSPLSHSDNATVMDITANLVCLHDRYPLLAASPPVCSEKSPI